MAAGRTSACSAVWTSAFSRVSSPVIGVPGGVSVAAGDINGDGRTDIITGAGAGGGPHPSVQRRRPQSAGRHAQRIMPRPLKNGKVPMLGHDPEPSPAGTDSRGRRLFPSGFRPAAQYVLGPGPGGTAPIQFIEPTGTRAIDAFPGFLGGVSVAVGDVNGDGVVDVVAGRGLAPGRTSGCSAADTQRAGQLLRLRPGVPRRRARGRGRRQRRRPRRHHHRGGPRRRAAREGDRRRRGQQQRAPPDDAAFYGACWPASSPTIRASPAACTWRRATSTATGAPTSSPAPAPAAARTCRCSAASMTCDGARAASIAYDPAFLPAACTWRRATSTATAAPTSSPAPARAAARTWGCSAAST